jgi:hypothetical protein
MGRIQARFPDAELGDGPIESTADLGMDVARSRVLLTAGWFFGRSKKWDRVNS